PAQDGAHSPTPIAVLSDGRRPPPHPHSFPTRRSSDLARGIPAVVGVKGATDAAQQGAIGIVDGTRGVAIFDPDPGTLQEHERKRSEEHTSELQSLRHLVCRLLLEKKK